MTLSYAFMLSFSGFLEPHIDATTWPLVWIVFFCVTVIDPLRLWHRPSRFWLLRNWIQLVFPGFTSVEVSLFLDDDSMSHSFLVCRFLDGRPVMFYDIFIGPPLLRRMCLFQWLAGPNHHLQSAEELDQWNHPNKHTSLYSIYSVPETIRGF